MAGQIRADKVILSSKLIIEKQMRMIKYMGETVMKMGFTFDEINSMFTSS
jgi:hypothetical protein